MSLQGPPALPEVEGRICQSKSPGLDSRSAEIHPGGVLIPGEPDEKDAAQGLTGPTSAELRGKGADDRALFLISRKKGKNALGRAEFMLFEASPGAIFKRLSDKCLDPG